MCSTERRNDGDDSEEDDEEEEEEEAEDAEDDDGNVEGSVEAVVVFVVATHIRSVAAVTVATAQQSPQLDWSHTSLMESHSGHAVRASNEVGRERSDDALWPRLLFPPFPPFLMSPLYHAFSGSSLRPLESACAPERNSTVLRGFSPQSQSSDDEDDDDDGT